MWFKWIPMRCIYTFSVDTPHSHLTHLFPHLVLRKREIFASPPLFILPLTFSPFCWIWKKRLCLPLPSALPFSAGALHVCYLPVAIPPGTGRWLNLWPPEREREREGRRPRGLLGVEGQLPAPFAKPAMGTTASIHIQILPGGRSKEAIDGGMEE